MQDYIQWWERDKETGLEDVERTFLELFSKVESLPSIYYPILYKYLKNDQIKYWNNDIFSFSKNKIEEIKNHLGKDNMLAILLNNFHLLVYAYENMLYIEERITIMNRFKGSEELKAKIFISNIYNDLLNTSFSELLKLFIKFESAKSGKDLSQNKLASQIECLSSPKRGYKNITDLADSNIRNAISHGGIKVSGSKIIFSYRYGQQYFAKESKIYDFKYLLLQLYDGVSAIILSWISYLCEENITYDEIYQNSTVHEDTSLFYERLAISTLLTSCDKIDQLKINNDGRSRQHVNIEFTGIDLDIDSRILFGLCTVVRIFQLRRLSLSDTIMISFRSPKVAVSFFTVRGSVINDLINEAISIEEAWEYIIKDNNVMMPPINDENRNEFEDLFRYYPDIETEDYRITEIEDISLENKKRFSAVVYLKRAKRPRHVKLAVEEIVNQLKVLENYGFSDSKVKHGTMEADILYIVLYKKELRCKEDRALFSNNNNFIAQVQYDIEMKFPIRNSIIDPHLKLRREKTIEYNWNPNFNR